MEEYRFNDGKVSPGGVFIGGRMHKTGAEVDGKHGRWYRLEWHKENGKSRLVQVSSRYQIESQYTCALSCGTFTGRYLRTDYIAMAAGYCRACGGCDVQ